MRKMLPVDWLKAHSDYTYEPHSKASVLKFVSVLCQPTPRHIPLYSGSQPTCVLDNELRLIQKFDLAKVRSPFSAVLLVQ